MNLLCILSIIAITAFVLIGHTYGQITSDNYLKMKGKILDGYTANITVYQEHNGDWSPIKTIKSRKNYSFKLNPKSNYYILFESTDGLNKVLYIDAGSKGTWVVNLDINFESRHIKHARMYQYANKNYTFRLIYKKNRNITIGTASADSKINNTFISSIIK